MKCLFCADIHRDVGHADERISNIAAEKPDVLVHCGDLCSWEQWESGLKWLRKVFPRTIIGLIPGNHDFYCHRDETIWEISFKQSELCKDYDIVYLPDDAIKINPNSYIIGSCLWYDYSFQMDRDYSENEIEEGFNNGRQWQDMVHVDVGTTNPKMSQWMLSCVQRAVRNLQGKQFIFVSHTLPKEEVNAHPPSLISAYTGQKNVGEYLDSLGDQMLAAFCGHTHKPAVFGKYTNLGSDYVGFCRYKVMDL